ncbi:MAG: transporter substrate-binding domain-containing protein, partial [Moritella sp.]|uniref:substrate-binding periplasmic protein n=1 Tax=Moritella sp. TaxID=78556 RepID=UPI0029A89DD8
MQSNKRRMNMRKIHKFLIIICFLSSSTVLAQTEVKTMFGGVNSWQSTLISAALDASGKQYTINNMPISGLGERVLRSVESGQIDVIWTMTSSAVEHRLTPIRIPLFKGLLGNRLPIINKTDESKFASLSNEQFKALKVGQVESWPDAKILKNDGLTVVTSIEYSLLYKMLNAKRFDYFTLGAAEIEGEFNRLGPETQKIDSNILIQYYSPAYFFVNPKKPELAKDIEAGLEILIASGKFDEMFYNQPMFKNIHERLGLT